MSNPYDRMKAIVAARCCGPRTLHTRSADASHNELATGIAAAPDAIPTTCHEQHGFQPDPVPAGVMEAIKADGAEQDRRNAAKSSTVYVALNTCASGNIPPLRFSTLADAQSYQTPLGGPNIIATIDDDADCWTLCAYPDRSPAWFPSKLKYLPPEHVHSVKAAIVATRALAVRHDPALERDRAPQEMDLQPAYLAISDEGDECIVKRFDSKAAADAYAREAAAQTGGDVGCVVMPTKVAFAAPALLEAAKDALRRYDMLPAPATVAERDNRMRETAALRSAVALACGTQPDYVGTLQAAEDVIDPRDVPPSAKCAALAFAAIDRSLRACNDQSARTDAATRAAVERMPIPGVTVDYRGGVA